LHIVDVTNPANPTEVGSYQSPEYSWAVAVAGSYAYMAGGIGGLRIVDITDPVNPTEVGTRNLGRTFGVTVVGDYVYAATEYGLRVIDVSNPAYPIQIAAYDDIYGYDVAVTGNYVYYVTNGLVVLRFTDVPQDKSITKSVTPAGQVDYGDEITYTLVISAVPGVQVGLYDPLIVTTFLRFVELPTGITLSVGIITGTLTVMPSNQVMVSFVTEVGVPGTAGITVAVVNSACVYPVGGTLDDCVWSNEVINSAFRPYSIYLPVILCKH